MKKRKLVSKNQNVVSKAKSCKYLATKRQLYPSEAPSFIDQLEAMRSYGIKEVFWKLTAQKKEEIEKAGFVVEPFIYRVRTKRFSKSSLTHGSSLLKSLHYGAVKGKTFISYKLKRPDMEFLRNNGISFKVLKYRIFLNP